MASVVDYHDVNNGKRLLDDHDDDRQRREQITMGGLLWAIIVILFVIWLLGLSFHILGGFIHIVLVVAVVLLIVNLLTGRGARV